MDNTGEVQGERGYVYVMQSECIFIKSVDDKNLICPVKIGSTINWKSRIGNLDGAVPVDFKIHLLVECDNFKTLEYQIHKELDAYRAGQRGSKNTEFFRLELKEAINRVRKIALRFAKRPRFIRKIPQLGRSAASISNMEIGLFRGDVKFTCSVPGGGEAHGNFIMDGAKCKFVVKAGSTIRRIPAPSFEKSRPLKYFRKWCEICRDHLNENGELKNDCVFDSRAAATSVVCASIRNGDREWIDKANNWCLGKYFGKC